MRVNYDSGYKEPLTEPDIFIVDYLLLIFFFMWFTADFLGKLPFLNEIWIQSHLTDN